MSSNTSKNMVTPSVTTGQQAFEWRTQLEQQNLDAYVPDSNLAQALNLGIECRSPACAPAHQRMRQKLENDTGRAAYARRKAIVEPVFGTLKQQRNLRQFRTRGIYRVGNEFTLATIAYNLTRIHNATK
jgi:hypothetical protein